MILARGFAACAGGADRRSPAFAVIEAHARKEEVALPSLRARLDERAMRRLSGGVEREKALIL